MKPFWVIEVKLFACINFSSRLLKIEKNILPIVFVKAIGRNSAGFEVVLDFEKRRMVADAQEGGI